MGISRKNRKNNLTIENLTIERSRDVLDIGPVGRSGCRSTETGE